MLVHTDLFSLHLLLIMVRNVCVKCLIYCNSICIYCCISNFISDCQCFQRDVGAVPQPV